MRTLISLLLLCASLRGGGSDVVVVVGQPTAVAGASYLIKQGFEGTGYDNSEVWTEAGAGTKDEDYTGVVLDGSQSLRIAMAGNNARAISPDIAGVDEIWAYFLLRPVDINEGALRIIAVLQNDSGSISLSVSATGTLRIEGTVAAATVSTISEGTTYHVWLHYQRHASAGVIDVGFSTTGVRPTSGNAFAQATTDATNQQVQRLVLGTLSGAVTQEYIFDKARLDDAQIGDTPE